MRLWSHEASGEKAPETAREYETTGFVLSGRARLHSEGQEVLLGPGDSWIVPQGAVHRYEFLEPFSAVEATSSPAEFHGRDALPTGK